MMRTSDFVIDINFFEYLKNAGNINANGDYSGSPVQFEYQNTGTKNIYISKVKVKIVDNGSLDSGRYADGIVLNNGIKIEKQDKLGNTLIDILAGDVILTNGDMIFNGDFPYFFRNGSGNEYLKVDFDFTKLGDAFTLKPTEKFAVILNDDFSSMREHKFKIIGNV